MADIDVCADARVRAFVNEANHGIDAVEQTEAERFKFEGDIDSYFVSVISEAAAGFEAPLPLRGGWNDFALPDVFAEDEEDVFRAPGFAPGR